MSKFLVFMSGARADILERYPAEKVKFETVGATVLIAGAVPSVGMLFALHDLLGVAIIPALIISLIWGLLIVALDRWLVVSVESGNRSALIAVLPRILFALLLSVIISTPLLLRIFQPEIQSQVAVIQRQRAEQFQNQVRDSTLAKELNRLQNSIREYQSVIASGGKAALNPSTDPTTQALKAQLNEARAKANSAYAKWQCQLYGGAGCVAGNGPAAQASQIQYQLAQQQVVKLQSEIDQRKNQLQSASSQDASVRLSQAKQDLPGAHALLAMDQQRLALEDQQFQRANRAPTDLLTQLTALNQLSSQDATLNTARFLILSLFALIECLPIAVKLLQTSGNYEEILALSQQHEVRATRFQYGVAGQMAFEQMRPHTTLKAGLEMQSVTDDEDSYDSALRGMQDIRSGNAEMQHGTPASGG